MIIDQNTIKFIQDFTMLWPFGIGVYIFWKVIIHPILTLIDIITAPPEPKRQYKEIVLRGRIEI